MNKQTQKNHKNPKRIHKNLVDTQTNAKSNIDF